MSSIALASTLHDPDRRFLKLLSRQGSRLQRYSCVAIAATETTDRTVVEALRTFGASVRIVPLGAAGSARRTALGAIDNAQSDVMSCDFDRWLHWADRFPDELTALPDRIGRDFTSAWYICLGRTARAFATHPRVQREAESATNRVLTLATGQLFDATAGAAWLSREGRAIILRDSIEATNATDLEWPALIHRVDPGRLHAFAIEGLEFETATFYEADIAAAGGIQTWITRHYDCPEVWAQRLRLAADSADALVRVFEDDGLK